MRGKIIRNKSFLTLLNLIVALGAVIYLWHAFSLRSTGLGVLPQTGDFSFLLVAVALIMVNLGFEAQKWRIAVSSEQRLSFGWALFYIVSSLPYGILTPSRIGEWYGRSRDFPRPGRGFVLSSLPGIAQQMITVIAGAVGVLILGNGNSTVWIGVISASVLLCVVSYIVLRKKRIWSGIGQIEWRLFVIMLMLSFLRYIVFSTQYVLLLKFFGVDGKWIILYAAIAVGYLVSYLLPLNAFVELGLRSSTVGYILGSIGASGQAVLWATVTVWFINVVLPSAAGSIMLVFRAVRKG